MHSVDRINNVAILCVVFDERSRWAPAVRLGSSILRYAGWNLECSVSCAKKKSKGKYFPVHVMKAYRGSRGIFPLILHLSARWKWVFKFTPRPFTSGKELRYPLCTYVNCGVSDNEWYSKCEHTPAASSLVNCILEYTFAAPFDAEIVHGGY